MPMTRSPAGIALASLLVGTAVLSAIGLVLMAANWPRPVTDAEWGFPGFQGAAALVFAGVGAPVAWTRPRNPIGWLLITAGVLSGLQFAGHQYAIFGLATAPGSVPEPWVGTWIEEWIWLPIMGALSIFTFFLFPTGTLVSPRWRIAAWVGLVGLALGTVSSAFVPLSRVQGAVNPLAPLGTSSVVTTALALGLALTVLTFLVALASLVVRFRRSAGVEHQQLKWLLLGGLVVTLGMGSYMITTIVTGDPYGPASAVAALLIFAVPVTMAVAMLRHGLYEVDRLLNRTVVYAVVSVVLVMLYGGAVLLLQPLLHSVTGGETLAVAGSTLLVATIFHPVRRRVQGSVDRRFFRSRYDARLTAERLGARLREEVDLERLASALLAEVGQTMQPRAASIWLRQR